MSYKDPVHGYTLTFEERPGYLYAYVEGDHDSYDVSRSFWDRVVLKVQELNAPAVMIDENIASGAPFADVFKLASEIPNMGFGRARIAFVDRYLDQSDINEFGELVAQNRGANGKIFNDAKVAEAWLLS